MSSYLLFIVILHGYVQILEIHVLTCMFVKENGMFRAVGRHVSVVEFLPSVMTFECTISLIMSDL